MDITRACRDIKELSPLAQEACNLFLEECRKQGLNILITETYRPQTRQDYLYQQGRTRPGKVVTWTHDSRHTSRRAWDICKNVKSQEYSDGNFFKKAGAIAKKLGITWGGTWVDSPDTPHFEINNNWVNPVKKKEVHKVEKTKIKLNGKLKEVESVEINGFNYVKLRDLEDSRISVEYSKVEKVPVINIR